MFFLPLTSRILMQKKKSRVVKGNCNPEWNDELTLKVKDLNLPISLVSNISFFDRIILPYPSCYFTGKVITICFYVIKLGS